MNPLPPPLMDGNTFAAILGIIFTTVFGSFIFTWSLHREFNKFKEETTERYYKIVERYSPMEDTFKIMRKVQESRLMESFLNDK